MMEFPNPNLLRSARVLGTAGLGILALLFPAIGPGRYLFSTLIFAVVIPAVLGLDYLFPRAMYRWGHFAFTLFNISWLVHCVPSCWPWALVLGGMVAVSPSCEPFRVRLASGLSFLLAMAFAGWYHEVAQWYVGVVGMLAAMPTMMVWLSNVEQERTARAVQSARLEAFTQIAGGIAHDFNNYLGAMRCSLDMAIRGTHEDDDRQLLLQNISSAVSRATALTAQLRSFSGLGDEAPQDLDSMAEVQAIVPLVRCLAPKGTAIVVSGPPRTSPVRLRRCDLQRVLLNLAVNSIQAIPGDRGEIRFHVSEASDGIRPRVSIAVQDNGCGISAKQLLRIFDSRFTTKPNGSGCGLGIVKGIVDAHEGQISVTSRVNHGTCVVVELPAAVVDKTIAPPRNPVLRSQLTAAGA